jgi:uncharacterized protein YndB with AHSA1/START domain
MTDHDTTARPDQVGADRALVLTQHVAAPPETVFEFLVEPDKVLRWLGTAIDLDPRAGGRFWMDANGTDVASGVYREVVRPERVVFTFGWEGSPHVTAGATTVTISLAPADDETTLVTLRHDGRPGGPEDQHREGWLYFLGRLAVAASGGDPRPVAH